jgi:hypothetical protein
MGRVGVCWSPFVEERTTGPNSTTAGSEAGPLSLQFGHLFRVLLFFFFAVVSPFRGPDALVRLSYCRLARRAAVSHSCLVPFRRCPVLRSAITFLGDAGGLPLRRSDVGDLLLVAAGGRLLRHCPSRRSLLAEFAPATSSLHLPFRLLAWLFPDPGSVSNVPLSCGASPTRSLIINEHASYSYRADSPWWAACVVAWVSLSLPICYSAR